MTSTKIRRCPRCKIETTWDDNPWKPFCSERCRMIDLGNWASEEYRVPLHETAVGIAGEVNSEFDPENYSDELV